MNKKIAIIGGGNLGTAIAEGLIKSKFCKPADITVTKRNITTLKELADKGVNITSDNAAAVRSSELVILAVKPFQVSEVINGFKEELTGKHLLVKQSISSMENLLSDHRFLRVHRSYMVSIEKITGFNNLVVQLQANEIPIGRLYKQAVMDVIHSR